MALQDPHAATAPRASNRMERAVGWFVLLAAGAGCLFGFWLLHPQHRPSAKGWFKKPTRRITTFLQSASGLKVGDPVMMMGFEAGRITDVQTDAHRRDWGAPGFTSSSTSSSRNYGYLWTEGFSDARRIRTCWASACSKVTKGQRGRPRDVFCSIRSIRNVSRRNGTVRRAGKKWLLGPWDAYDCHGYETWW